MTNKGDTIAEIISLNPTADSSFLEEFADQELDDYLSRLRAAARSRIPMEMTWEDDESVNQRRSCPDGR